MNTVYSSKLQVPGPGALVGEWQKEGGGAMQQFAESE
jgi:hypothetical protein